MNRVLSSAVSTFVEFCLIQPSSSEYECLLGKPEGSRYSKHFPCVDKLLLAFPGEELAIQRKNLTFKFISFQSSALFLICNLKYCCSLRCCFAFGEAVIPSPQL